MTDDEQDTTDAEARAILNRSMIPHLRIRYEDMAWLYREKTYAAVGALVATSSVVGGHVHAESPAFVVWTWVGVSVLWLGLAIHSIYAADTYRKLARFFTDPGDQDAAIWR